MSVYTLSAGVVLSSGDINAEHTTGTELPGVVRESMSDTYNLSCFLAPILKPCSLYGGLVATDV